MADKTVILELQVNEAQALKSISDLSTRISTLKKEQQELAKATGTNTAEYKAYQAQITSLTKEQKSLENAVSQSASALNFEKGSIAANRAELSKLTAEYKNLANPTKNQTKAIKDLSDRLKEQESAIGNTSRNVGNYTQGLAGAVGQNNAFGRSLNSGIQGFEGLKGGLNSAKLGFTGLRAAIAASGIGLLVLLLGSLVSYFTSTDEGADMLSRTLAGIGAVMEELISRAALLGKAIVQLFQGDFSGAVDTASKAFDDLGDSIKKSYEEAAILADRLDALEDAELKQSVLNAKRKNEVDLLIKQSKDRVRGEKERLALLDQASGIERKGSEEEIRLAKERRDIAQANLDIDIRRGKIQKGNISKEFADAEIAYQNAIGSSAEKLAAIDARRSAFLLEESKVREEFAKKELERIQKIREAQEQALAERIKSVQELDKAEQELANVRYNNRIREIDRNLAAEGISDERRIELLKQREKTLQDIEIQSMMTKLDNATLLQDQRTAIEEETASKLIDIKQKTDDQITAINKKSIEQQIKDDEALAAQKKQILDQNVSYAHQATAILISFQQSQNQIELDERLEANETARAKDLKAAGNNEEKKKRLNAKYDKIKLDEERKAKRKQLDLQIVSALADGAAGLIKTLNSIPYPYSLIPAGLLALTTAANVAQLSSQKSKLAKGGLLSGPSHSTGGITGTGRFSNIEVEGGEFVVNKRAYQMFPDLVEQINNAGLGMKAFNYNPNYMADGGMISSSAQGSVADPMNNIMAMRELLSSLPEPVVRVSDINASQSRVAKIRDIANVTK